MPRGTFPSPHKCGRRLTRGDMRQREQGEEMSLTKFYTRKTGVESMKTDANCRAMLSRYFRTGYENFLKV